MNEIININELNKEFVKSREVNKTIDQIIQTHQNDLKTLYDYVTPLELTNQLQRMQTDLSKRMQGNLVVALCLCIHIHIELYRY